MIIFLVAFMYLTIPVFLILFTFFSSFFVITSGMAFVLLIFCLSGQRWNLHNNPLQFLAKYWPLLLVALATTIISIVSPFATLDWARKYATFNLLLESSWPPTLELDGQTWFMRYYLAWYMVPVLLAKIFGPQFLVPAISIWTAMGLFIALTLAFHNLRKVKHLFLAGLVFLFFSGLDLVGAWLVGYSEEMSPYWLHWWAGGSARAVVILSNLTNFQLAPQHAICAFLTTCLFLYNRRLALQYGGVIIIVATLWSPFCAIGSLPLVLWAIFKEGYKTAITLQNLVVAPLLSIPIVLYLTQGTSQIPFMFVWEVANFTLFLFNIFLALEFLIILSIFWFFIKDKRELVAIIAVFLCFLCLFKVGVYSDLISRGSIPAICVMSILMLQSILQNRGWRRELLVACVLIAAVPVVLALGKSIAPSLPRQDRSVTLAEWLDKFRPLDGGIDSFRGYFLIDTADAVHISAIPLMRGLKVTTMNKKNSITQE